MATYTHKALRGATNVLFFSVLASIIAYLTRIVLARNLSIEEFGLFYSVFTIIIFFLFFRDLGFGEALVKYIAEFRAQNQPEKIKTAVTSVFTFQLIGSIIIALVFLILSDYLAEHYFKNPLASSILNMLVLYTLFSILFTNIKQVFQGFQEMFLYSTIELVKNLIVLILILLFFYFNFGVFSPVWAFVLVSPLLFLIYFPFVLKKCSFFKHKITDFKEVSKKLIFFSIPVFATSVGGMIIGYVDTLVLTYYGTLTQVGIYNAVLPSALIFIFFGKALCSVIYPLSSELWAKGDKKRLSQGISLLHRYIFVLIIPIMIPIIVYSNFFLTTFFGIDYGAGATAFQILLVGVSFYILASVNNNMISAIGKPKEVTVIVFLAAASNFGLNILLIPKYGINGAAFATAFCYFFSLVASTLRIRKHIGLKVPLKQWLLLVFPAVSMYLITLILKQNLTYNVWINLFFSILVATIIYLILILIFGLVNLKELRFYYQLYRNK